MKGSYILLIEQPEEQTITVGSREALHFPCGYYAYAGSAMGGLGARLSHHFRTNKKPRWHIDYLLQKASISSVITCETEEKTECAIARALRHRFNSIPGFGASDCKCPSHLFFAAEEMRATIMAVLYSLGMKPESAKHRENK